MLDTGKEEEPYFAFPGPLMDEDESEGVDEGEDEEWS